MINEEIERLRHASTQALLTRKDVIIVASVSCIYGLGNPEEYERINAVSHTLINELSTFFIFPAKHFITADDAAKRALLSIKQELNGQLAKLNKEGKLLEAERLKRRTTYDLAMIREIGYANGIENYSRHFSGKLPGEAPFTLLDYFPKDFLTIIDESHVTVPQIGGMYTGDKSRKDVLIEHGFRLPSARDNRPLKFTEFEKRVGQVIFTSATPA